MAETRSRRAEDSERTRQFIRLPRHVPSVTPNPALSLDPPPTARYSPRSFHENSHRSGAHNFRGPASPMTAAPAIIPTHDASFHERHAWLALALTPGIGPRRILTAVERCGCADHVLHLPLTELEALQFPAQAAQFIVHGEAAHAADQELEKLAASCATILTYRDEAYPERLRQIFDPPALLWIRGDVSLLARSSIAVVGTRHPTPYGTGMAERLSRDLALRGLIILSGMAR